MEFAAGDAAASFYHEAQLRRAGAAFQPQLAEGCRASAERFIRGVLTVRQGLISGQRPGAFQKQS